MIRTTLMLAFWTVCAPIAALIGFPAALLTGNVRVLYRTVHVGSAGRSLAHRSPRPKPSVSSASITPRATSS